MPVRHLSPTQSTGHRRYKKQQQWLSTVTNVGLDIHNFLPDSVTHTQQWQHYASWNTSYANPAADCPALPPFLSSAAPRDGNMTPPTSSLEVPQTWQTLGTFINKVHPCQPLFSDSLHQSLSVKIATAKSHSSCDVACHPFPVPDCHPLIQTGNIKSTAPTHQL